MRISRYFTDLMATYVAEIDDLKTDSGGGDVLNARLKDKRSQFAGLMPMMQSNPEMLAVIFHKAIAVKDAKTILSYLSKEPHEFPEWSTIASCVQFQPWAAAFVDQLATTADGEEFLLTTVMLEYLLSRYEISEEQASHDNDDDMDDDDDGADLNEAGSEWMAEQGFDSHQ
jgi:hypothetical protein